MLASKPPAITVASGFPQNLIANFTFFPIIYVENLAPSPIIVVPTSNLAITVDNIINPYSTQNTDSFNFITMDEGIGEIQVSKGRNPLIG